MFWPHQEHIFWPSLHPGAAMEPVLIDGCHVGRSDAGADVFLHSPLILPGCWHPWPPCKCHELKMAEPLSTWVSDWLHMAKDSHHPFYCHCHEALCKQGTSFYWVKPVRCRVPVAGALIISIAIRPLKVSIYIFIYIYFNHLDCNSLKNKKASGF